MPAYTAIEMSKEWKSSMGLYLEMLESLQVDLIKQGLNNIQLKGKSDSSCRKTYIAMNP